MNSRKVLGFLALLVFGAVRLPLERQLEREYQAAHLNVVRLNLTLRDQIGQMGFVAALSGFRAPVADGLWIHANSIWADRTDWAGMKVDFDAVTALQPRCILFWDMAAWHMYANASIAAAEDRKQPREALRLKAQREYWKLGENYLKEGIANNPEDPTLYISLGNLYRDRLVDHCKASAEYAKAVGLPHAMAYAERFAAYELARCPDHEREGYEKLLGLYKRGIDEHTPTLLKLLGELQEKFHIPEAEKVDTSAAKP